MKILVTDFHCAANRGDAAILEGTLTALQRELPEARITVLTDYPEAARVVNRIDGALRQPFATIQWRDRVDWLRMGYLLVDGWLRGQGWPMSGPGDVALRPYREADLVISKGGSFLNDFYMPGILGRLWAMQYAKALGKPVFLYGQSIGPLDGVLARTVAAYVLDQVDVIVLRDEESRSSLRELGVTRPEIHVTPDAAFAMAYDVEEPLAAAMQAELEPSARARIRVSISVRHWRFYRRAGGHERYLDAVAELADWLVQEPGADVVFASTCTSLAGYHTDDRLVAREIIDRMSAASAGNPRVLSGDYRPAELARFLGRMTLHVGTRMHSNVLALLEATPVVALEYEFKSTGLMRLFRLESWLLDVNDLSGPRLIARAAQALEQRDRLVAQIEARLPEVKRRAHEGARIIRRWLEEHGPA